VLERLPDASEYEYGTDTGQVIRVRITVDRPARKATVDFTGTSPVMKNNFNAPEPVARAAVLYTFRVMVEDNIPMNAGCLRPIDIVIPQGCMLRPAYPAAVVAGNVETSQHVTNALFGAMGALANAQGTMNNLTFGNAKYQYYETICGGSGAGRKPWQRSRKPARREVTRSKPTSPPASRSCGPASTTTPARSPPSRPSCAPGAHASKPRSPSSPLPSGTS